MLAKVCGSIQKLDLFQFMGMVEPMTTESLVTERLKEAGMRITAPRLAVFSVVSEEAHIAADDVARGVRHKLGTVSTQTVYDALRTLVAVGLVGRIEPAGHPVLYETRTGDNHHHVVCRACGRVEDVACAIGEAPCLTAAESHGFAIDEAEVVYWGTCPDCAAKVPEQVP